MSEEELKINQRLDELQNADPTPEMAEEYCALLRELRRFRPQPKPDRPFHRQCWQWRGMIWMAAISLCIFTFFFLPLFSDSLGAVTVIMLLASVVYCCWAVWVSSYHP